MIISKIHIENFGKLSNFDLELDENLFQINRENGWGKTTLCVFIKAMLYGMPPSRDNYKMERKKYMPWQGGNYGGYLEYITEKGKYRITRFFGKTPEGDSEELFDLNVNKMVELPKIPLGEEIFGVGRETFEMTAFFPQSNFIANVGNNQLSASLLGLDKFQYDLANLNLAIDKIKKKITDLKRGKIDKKAVEELKLQIQNNKNDLEHLEKKLVVCREALSKVKDEIAILTEREKEINSQVILQEKLYNSKLEMENDLHEKTEELNQLLKELENLDKEGKIAPKRENKPLMISSTIVIGVLLIGLTFLLYALKVLTIIPTVIISVIIIILIVTTDLLLLKKYKVPKEVIENQENNKINKEKIKNNVELLDKYILDLKNKLFELEDIEKPNYEKTNEIKELIYNSKLKIERLSSEEEITEKDINNLFEKIEQKEEELKEIENQNISINKKLELLTLTRDFLLKANENVSSRFIQPVNYSLSQLLNRFDLKGRNFVVDTGFSIKEITDLGAKELDYSSQGFKDLLSFCMRIYLANEVFKREKPFIILDDTFVNLDDNNLLKIKEIVKEFSKSFQIIYMSCNSQFII